MVLGPIRMKQKRIFSYRDWCEEGNIERLLSLDLDGVSVGSRVAERRGARAAVAEARAALVRAGLEPPRAPPLDLRARLLGAPLHARQARRARRRAPPLLRQPHPVAVASLEIINKLSN